MKRGVVGQRGAPDRLGRITVLAGLGVGGVDGVGAEAGLRLVRGEAEAFKALGQVAAVGYLGGDRVDERLGHALLRWGQVHRSSENHAPIAFGKSMTG